jgi:hypothetical protein
MLIPAHGAIALAPDAVVTGLAIDRALPGTGGTRQRPDGRRSGRIREETAREIGDASQQPLARVREQAPHEASGT